PQTTIDLVTEARRRCSVATTLRIASRWASPDDVRLSARFENRWAMGRTALLDRACQYVWQTIGYDEIATSLELGQNSGSKHFALAGWRYPFASFDFEDFDSGADGTRTRGLRRDRPAL